MNENKPILRNPLTGFAENLWDENVVKLKKKKAAAAPAALAAAPADAATAAAPAAPAANSNPRKNKTLKKSLGKRNLFQSNANRLKQIQNEANAANAANAIQYGNTEKNILPNTSNKPLNALPSGERSLLNRMKSFVTRPFRSSPEATLTKSSTNRNRNSSFRNITNNTITNNNITNNNIKKSKTRKRKY